MEFRLQHANFGGTPFSSWASQMVLVVKNPPDKAGDIRDTASIPGLGRCPGGGHGNPLQYSCLGNPRTVEPGGLQSIGSQSFGHDSSDLAWTDSVHTTRKWLCVRCGVRPELCPCQQESCRAPRFIQSREDDARAPGMASPSPCLSPGKDGLTLTLGPGLLTCAERSLFPSL